MIASTISHACAGFDIYNNCKNYTSIFCYNTDNIRYYIYVVFLCSVSSERKDLLYEELSPLELHVVLVISCAADAQTLN